MPQSSRQAPLIVFEGIDGAGKGTQAAALVRRLTAVGHEPALISFPRYQDTFFGGRIGEFLNGKFGSLDQVHPFFASLLYAGDRFESSETLKTARTTRDVVILDRYVPSNIAHQSSKLEHAERTRLQDWIEHIEYETFQLPKPDLVILLDVPVDVSQQLIRSKAKRAYTDQQTDLQEANIAYQQRVREVYLNLAAENSSNWRVIPITDSNELRPLIDIEQDIWKTVQPWLPRLE